MIFFANALGTITKIITEPVYQGSVNTGRVVLIAPFPSSVQVTVAFTLPNGMNTQINLTKPNMANVDLGGRVLSPEGKTYNAWTYILNEVITAYAGEATVQFFVYDASGTVVTTYASTFDISPGVPPQLPITPTATIYTEILEALAALNSRIDNITGEESETSATFVNIVNELPDIPINKDGIYIVKNGDSIPQLYVYNKEVGVWIRLDEAVINVDAVEDATDTTKLYNVNNIGLHAFINDKWTLLATAETVGVVNQTAQNALTAANQAQEVANTANATAENAKTVANEAMAKVNSVKGGIIFKGNVSNIADLDAPSAETLGYLYNVSTPFETTENFVEGAGKKYPANENVAIVELEPGVYKYDVFSGLIDLSGYQEKLASGENIKTINNQSILGSGNLDIPKGDTGPQGPQGPAGPQGPQGLPGENYVLELTGEEGTLTNAEYQALVDNFPNVVIKYTVDNTVVVHYPFSYSASSYEFHATILDQDLFSSKINVTNDKKFKYTLDYDDLGNGVPIEPSGATIIELQGPFEDGGIVNGTGTLTDEQLEILQNNFNNTIVKMVFATEEFTMGYALLPIQDMIVPSVGPFGWSFATTIVSDGQIMTLALQILIDKSWTFNFEINELGGGGELAKLNEDNIFQGNNEFYGETYFDGNVEMSNTNFSGDVDFSNANVTGLPTSGGGKTKITLAELQTMCSGFDYDGKLIQIVAKPTADIMLYHCTRHLPLHTILRGTIGTEKTVSYLSASELRIATWELRVGNSYAYFLTGDSVLEIENNGITFEESQEFNLSDNNVDIYLIGG